MTDTPFDAIVIGMGFGGAVAACRLAQAGKTVCILERGRRYPLREPLDLRRAETLYEQAMRQAERLGGR